MRLRDLDAEFVGEYAETTRRLLGVNVVDGVQGINFQCPKCAQTCDDGGVEPDAAWCAAKLEGRSFVRGAHYVLCWFTNPVNAPRVPDSADPKPGRWPFEGTSIDDVTLTGSVFLTEPRCGWHGHITNGEASLQ